jgi:glycosyltransferase involved in cell wall biosynthesis
MNQRSPIQTLLVTCGAWYLRETAGAFEQRDALAGLWISDKNKTRIPGDRYRRCLAFHLAMTPFYRLAPQIWVERFFYVFFPLWRGWVLRQPWPDCNVVHAIMGYATEPFARAEGNRALKVLDCQNSHPTSYYGYWQRECDLWCPGEKVPIPRWMFARMNRELERADLVLCPSDFVRDTMVHNGIPEQKCFVNPFGSNTSIFRKREQVPAKPRFICVGTICLRKGHQYLFRAFEKLRKEIPEAELICVGEIKRDFRKEQPRWEGSFKHIEAMQHAELAELLRTCSGFVLASVEEGFARVLAEAMAAGLPIIATYESGATTLVRDGTEGFVVPARDSEKLFRAMRDLGSNRELNWAMGEAAWKRGAARNSWLDYGDRLIAQYALRSSLG